MKRGVCWGVSRPGGVKDDINADRGKPRKIKTLTSSNTDKRTTFVSQKKRQKKTEGTDNASFWPT